MKKLIWILGLSTVVVAAVCFEFFSQNVQQISNAGAKDFAGKNSNEIRGSGKDSPDNPDASFRKVVVQTGQVRFTNAVRCLIFTVGLANSIPKEMDGLKGNVSAIAGVLFFNDCLMSKSKKGQVYVGTNEIIDCFTNALSELFSNEIPGRIMDGLYYSFPDPTNFMGDHPGPSDVARDLVEGFKGCFIHRNNIMRYSLEDHYAHLAGVDTLSPMLRAIESAFKTARVADAKQSDLKLLCLTLCGTRTSLDEFLGPPAVDSFSRETAFDRLKGAVFHKFSQLHLKPR